MADVKEVALSCIDKHKEELRSLSEKIWLNPELCYEEHKAHSLLTDYLESKGFTVERGFCGIPTAFKATFGNAKCKEEGVNVCVISEYDALPGIGHACGHNLIAEAGVAAGLGLKAAIESGLGECCVTVMGTPAEEGGGGKVKLINGGAFDDVSIALMVHPNPLTAVFNQYLALSEVTVTYSGKAAHAAAFPWEGLNALDAAVMAYNAISMARQQFKPTWRVHGIITNGGVKPNIIPEKATLNYLMRAPTRNELKELQNIVIHCFEAAATATRCEVDVSFVGCSYENVLTNPLLGKLFEQNLKEMGYKDILPSAPAGSTDMGNVSHVVPSIHPKYAIGDGKAANHTPEFTQVANEPEAHERTLQAAKAMVLTGIEVMQNRQLMAEVKEIFDQEKNSK